MQIFIKIWDGRAGSPVPLGTESSPRQLRVAISHATTISTIFFLSHDVILILHNYSYNNFNYGQAELWYEF